MKTKNYIQLLMALLCPTLLNAQWSAVRFDHTNTFEKVFTVTPDTAFIIGTPSQAFSVENFILRTNNGGTTWDSIPLNLGQISANSYAYTQFYINGTVGFVGGLKYSKQTLLKTIDNGNTWTTITPDTNSTERIQSIYFIDALNGWATDGWNAIYKTTNGGNTWTTIPIISPIHDIHFFDANNGFACGELWWSAGAIVYKTSDGGQTWTGLLNAVGFNLFVSSFNKIDFINPYEGFTLLGNTNVLFRTLDAGATWDSILAPVQYVNDFDFTSADTGHIVSADGEVFVTNDGGQNWTLEYQTSWGFYGPNVYLNSLSFVVETGYVCGTNGLVKKHTVSTGISEQLSNNTINIYPNPLNTSNNLFISTPEPIENGSVKIINTIGQIVFDKKINAISSNSTITLSDIDLPADIYYLTLETKKNKTTEKLIIVK